MKGISKKGNTPGNISGSDKVIISSEYFEDTRPSFICSICNQTLIRLTDAGMNNTSFWCRNCSVEFNPEEENVRRESKLSVPDRSKETAVSTTPSNLPNPFDKQPPELSGGFRELAKKGTIKFTEYREEIPKKRSWKVGSGS